MEVQFYSFSKKNKSTARPSGNAGLTLQCTWKDATSIQNPTMLLSTNVTGYNYCYIPDWGRYYFYSDLVTVNNMWELTLSEDYLATWRTQISATSCNILYATGSTKSIVDGRIPVLSTILRGHNTGTVGSMQIIANNGVTAKVIGITGKGSFGSYLMQDANAVPELLDGIDTSLWTDPLDFFKQAAYGTSAAECLRSVIGLPLVISPSEIGSSTATALYLGNYPCLDNGTSINGYLIKHKVITYTGTIAIPWQSSDWNKVSAYSNITLYLPLVGVISIGATDAQNDSNLQITYSINVTSGDITVKVEGNESGVFLATASGNCAVPEAFGSTGINTSKLMTSNVAGAGAVAAGIASAVATGGLTLPIAMAIGGGLATAATGTISALGGSASGSAGLGGGSAYGLDKVVHIWVTQKALSDTQSNFNPIMGKPYMGVSTPGSFSGYVQTDGFQLNATAYESEKNAVNNMMDTGVYME